MRIVWKILSGLLALLLCMVALGGIVSTAVLDSVEYMFTRKAIERMLEKAEIDQILEQLLSSEGENMLTQVADSEPVKEIVVDYLAGYGEYLLKGTANYAITEAQKAALLDAVIDGIISQLGEMDESTEKLLRMQTETTLEGMLTQYIPPYNELDIGFSEDLLEGLRLIFSSWVRSAAWGLVAAAMLLIMLLRFSLHEWMAWGGFTGLIGGLILLGARSGLNWAAQSAAVGDEMINNVITAFFSEFQSRLLLHGLCIIGLSILLIVLFFVIRACIHRNRTAGKISTAA